MSTRDLRRMQELKYKAARRETRGIMETDKRDKHNKQEAYKYFLAGLSNSEVACILGLTIDQTKMFRISYERRCGHDSSASAGDKK